MTDETTTWEKECQCYEQRPFVAVIEQQHCSAIKEAILARSSQKWLACYRLIRKYGLVRPVCSSQAWREEGAQKWPLHLRKRLPGSGQRTARIPRRRQPQKKNKNKCECDLQKRESRSNLFFTIPKVLYNNNLSYKEVETAKKKKNITLHRYSIFTRKENYEKNKFWGKKKFLSLFYYIM